MTDRNHTTPFKPIPSSNAGLCHQLASLTALTALLSVGTLSAQQASDTSGTHALHEILPPMQVSSSQKIAQQTPIATHKSNVYIVNIEAGESGDEDDINLHTVIRRGEVDSTGAWTWSDKTLETHTIIPSPARWLLLHRLQQITKTHIPPLPNRHPQEPKNHQRTQHWPKQTLP